MNGKGDARRAQHVDRKTLDKNWARTFKRKEPPKPKPRPPKSS